MADWYIDGDNGSDGNTGASEVQAFATIQKGVDDGGGDDTIYVQNNGATVYGEMVTITDKTMTLIGYGSTITDGVKAVIDGADTRANCILFNNTAGTPGLRLFNFELKQATSHGLFLNRTAAGTNSIHRIDNVWSHDNGADGFRISWNNQNTMHATRCRADLNVAHGFYQVGTASELVYIDCTAFDNAGSGFKSDFKSTTAIACIAARNAVNFDRIVTKAFCTSDAADGDNNWYTWDAFAVAFACGFSNAAAFGINGELTKVSLFNCGFYNNTSGDKDGTPLIEIGSVSGSDPLYTNAANEDYSLGSSSPWKQQDILIGDPDQAASTSYPDIGAVQINVTGGGGGLLTHPGMAGGMRG